MPTLKSHLHPLTGGPSTQPLSYFQPQQQAQARLSCWYDPFSKTQVCHSAC